MGGVIASATSNRTLVFCAKVNGSLVPLSIVCPDAAQGGVLLLPATGKRDFDEAAVAEEVDLPAIQIMGEASDDPHQEAVFAEGEALSDSLAKEIGREISLILGDDAKEKKDASERKERDREKDKLLNQEAEERRTEVETRTEGKTRTEEERRTEVETSTEEELDCQIKNSLHLPFKINKTQRHQYCVFAHGAEAPPIQFTMREHFAYALFAGTDRYAGFHDGYFTFGSGLLKDPIDLDEHRVRNHPFFSCPRTDSTVNEIAYSCTPLEGCIEAEIYLLPCNKTNVWPYIKCDGLTELTVPGGKEKSEPEQESVVKKESWGLDKGNWGLDRGDGKKKSWLGSTNSTSPGLLKLSRPRSIISQEQSKTIGKNLPSESGILFVPLQWSMSSSAGNALNVLIGSGQTAVFNDTDEMLNSALLTSTIFLASKSNSPKASAPLSAVTADHSRTKVNIPEALSVLSANTALHNGTNMRRTISACTSVPIVTVTVWKVYDPRTVTVTNTVTTRKSCF